MSDLRFVRAQDRHLSLWQSAVAENVRERMEGEPSAIDVLEHPLMRATSDHVEAVLEKGRDADLRPAADAAAAAVADDRQTAAYVSQLAFMKALAMADGDTERAAALDVEFRKYSDKDYLGFGTCITTFLAYMATYKGVFRYNDWTKEGGGNPEYGVISWRLPNNAVIGVIGDWGTGLNDAKQLLRDLMVKFKPAAIIHLGDIYYSATPSECNVNYANIITQVFNEVLGSGNRIPVFTLAGNHDYYALGYGFYPVVNAMNNGIAGATQAASYFCLRTADNGWQFLAMDTGYYDSNPGDQADPTYAGPWLHPTEVQWLQHKLNTFPGATVLLSHHQLFSAHAKLNGMASSYCDLPYLNPFLREAFERYFASNVAAWLWGHEHNFAVYRNGLFGLAKGRLVGCSAYEELVSSEPYKVNYPQAPYLDPTQYRLDATAGYFNHGYGVINLANRVHPTDPVSITYYQYPSWGAVAPPTPASSVIFTETVKRPVAPPTQSVVYGAPLHLLAQEGLYVGPLYTNIQNYPTMSVDAPVALTIQGHSGAIRHGEQVQIKTSEPKAGAYNVLGAWSTVSLYYYTPGSDNQVWTVQKRDPSKPEVNYGDDICFVNRSYGGQYLQPYWSVVWGAVYLTTRSGEPYYWTAQPGTALTPFQSWLLETGIPIPEAEGAGGYGGWALADFNRDGVPDLFGIKVRNTGTRNVEVHVLSGASAYQSWLLETGIPIPEAEGAGGYGGWALADFNRDGVPDLFGIKVRNTGTRNVEVHVLSGASGYQSWLLQTAIPISEAEGAGGYGGWALADFNRDGVPDLFGIKVRNTGTRNVEVHVLSGASGYQGWLLQTGIPITEADGSANYGAWKLANFDGDGVPDLFGIKVRNSTGNVEVHALSGASRYQSWLVQVSVPILQADGAGNFAGWALADFEGNGVTDLFGIKVRNTGTHNVEVHALRGA
jgi:hypothetical protein